jgi:phage terminase large subunit-like protein
VEASPLLQAKVRADRIEFSNGSYIQALASDYRGAAGVSPTMVVADELWGFSSESSMRLYEECCPTPTRKPSVRMITTYAGFTGESTLLENLVKRGLAGEPIAKDLYTQPGMIAFISHDRIAPWQSEAWLEEARKSTRPSAFMRQYLNHFTAGETNYVDMADYDRCVDVNARPALNDPNLRVFVGLDGSYQHDSTAIAVTTFDAKTQKSCSWPTVSSCPLPGNRSISRRSRLNCSTCAAGLLCKRCSSIPISSWPSASA